MTTLAIALAQSPIRAAQAQTANGTVEVRGLMYDRYELLTVVGPTWTGDLKQITEAAAYLRADGRELDWQPLWERSTPSQAPQVAKGIH